MNHPEFSNTEIRDFLRKKYGLRAPFEGRDKLFFVSLKSRP
jgi:hypothetical protein